MEALSEYWEHFVDIDGPLHVLYGIGIAVGFYLAALLLRALNRKVLARLERREDAASRQRHGLLAAAERPIAQALVVFGIYLASEQLPIVDRAHGIVNGILFAIGAYFMTRGASGIVRTGISLYGERVAARHEEEPDIAFFSLLRTLGGLIVWIVGFAVVLHHFYIDVASVLAALGVGSLAVGLAAKDTLGNMIAGFIILLDRPFREGDRIKLVSGEVGDVREIGLRSTKIALFDETYLVVPNGELVNLRVVNQAYPTRRIRGQIAVGIEYGADLAGPKRLLEAVLRANAEVLQLPAPAVEFSNLTNSALELTVSFWVADYARLGPVTEVIRTACYEALAGAGVGLAFPMQTIHLRQEKRGP